MKLYMAVTPDKYELPLIVCDTAKELASKLGISPETIYSSISRKIPGTTTGRRFVVVEYDEDFEKEEQ